MPMVRAYLDLFTKVVLADQYLSFVSSDSDFVTVLIETEAAYRIVGLNIL
jgi:hypothetical protein